MYVSPEMLEVLDRKVDEGWFSYKEFRELVGGEAEALRLLLDMYCEGLLEYRSGDVFLVSDAGRRLVEVWRSLGKPDARPWIDSRVYWMLYYSVRAGGRLPSQWASILAERGFLIEGELSPAGYAVVEVFEKSPKRLVVTKAVAAALLEVPEGPAEKQYYSTKWLDVMEAMGLIVKSIPRAAYIALTRPARMLRKAFQRVNLDAPYTALVNEKIYRGLEAAEKGEEVEPETEEALKAIGYLTPARNLTRPGRLVLEAWRILNKPFETTPTALSRDELALMKTVRDYWEKSKTNPEIKPTRKLLSEKFKPQNSRYYTVGLLLYQLEALGLVREEIDEEGKQVVRFTKLGEQVLDTFGLSETTALGSRTLIEADSMRSPAEDWIPKSREEGLLGPRGPTRRGILLAKASRTAERSILVTSLEALILKRLPENRTIPRSYIVNSFKGSEADAQLALDKLETKGLVATRPDGRIELTEPGRLVKEAVMGVPTGVATPVHPHIIRLLRALSEEKTDDVAKLVKKTRLSLGALKDALILARACKYIGRGASLTAAGKALLEAVDLLQRSKTAEEL
ncbi:MAG: DUF505 domain-containing protein [Crenarchaeota archaeon]|nr:DUF505 domain-containing protein [Thermoproteota archaeon]